MPYCRYCGKELAEGAKFCANCGAPVAAETAPQIPLPMAPKGRPLERPARPVGVSVIAILEAMVSFFMLIGGIALIGVTSLLAVGFWENIPQQELENAFRKMPWAQAFTGMQVIAVTVAVLMIVGFTVLILAIVGLAMSWGLWTGKRWARTITMGLSVIGILLAIFSLPGSVLSLLIYAAILYYLTRPYVKAYYSR